MAASKKPKLLEEPKIRPELFNDDVITSIQNLWGSAMNSGLPPGVISTGEVAQVDIVTNPFNVCLVRDLLSPQTIRDAVQQLSQVEFLEKSNDLYEFKQTEDVATLTHIPAIKQLYDVIKTDVFKWVEKTLVPSGLKENVAATFSCYAYGDHLLCHDDQCEDRHIAFVLYLTEDWCDKDGGSLDLFNTDSNGDPAQVVLSLQFQFNTLVLFEVASNSFHQVAEVLSKSKKRLSLNGWFHKANLPHRPEQPPYTLTTHETSSLEVNLSDFMFEKYLTLRNQIDIKTIFVANSEIQLDLFFQADVFKKIREEFSSVDVVWKTVGPANIRNYEIADLIPEEHVTLNSITQCLQSRSWARWLRNITGLDLVPAANSDLNAWQRGTLPTCKIQVQRWLPGNYTLVHDRDPEFHMAALDVFLRVPVCEGDDVDCEGETPKAGHVIYIDKDSKDDECLLHLGYKMNSLCLIFREPGTLRFTKYLHSLATPFYQIQCTYVPWSPPADDPHLKHVDSEAEDEMDEDAAFDEVEGIELEGIIEEEEEEHSDSDGAGENGS